MHPTKNYVQNEQIKSIQGCICIIIAMNFAHHKFAIAEVCVNSHGATAEYSSLYHTAARLEFKSCLQRVRVVVWVRAVLQ